MNPQLLHDIWLGTTAVAIFALAAIAVYLWKSFPRTWFLRALALVFAVVAIDMFAGQVKNFYYRAPPTDAAVSLLWLGARVVAVLVSAGVLGYMIFGRNGNSVDKPAG